MNKEQLRSELYEIGMDFMVGCCPPVDITNELLKRNIDKLKDLQRRAYPQESTFSFDVDSENKSHGCHGHH
uniref:Uncharacterized protein n=1 Tax=viral metagenome TaxID=1070528 RepID=A0A6H1ZGZ7_9ZZZZ